MYLLYDFYSIRKALNKKFSRHFENCLKVQSMPSLAMTRNRSEIFQTEIDKAQQKIIHLIPT